MRPSESGHRPLRGRMSCTFMSADVHLSSICPYCACHSTGAAGSTMWVTDDQASVHNPRCPPSRRRLSQDHLRLLVSRVLAPLLVLVLVPQAATPGAPPGRRKPPSVPGVRGVPNFPTRHRGAAARTLPRSGLLWLRQSHWLRLDASLLRECHSTSSLRSGFVISSMPSRAAVGSPTPSGKSMEPKGLSSAGSLVPPTSMGAREAQCHAVLPWWTHQWHDRSFHSRGSLAGAFPRRARCVSGPA